MLNYLALIRLQSLNKKFQRQVKAKNLKGAKRTLKMISKIRIGEGITWL